jgi:hypothetical protein
MLERQILALILFAAVGAGCSISTTANFYPVSGPLSKIKPLPVMVANVSHVESTTGGLSLVMPDGEACEGRWSSVAPTYYASGIGTLWGGYGGSIGFSGTTVGNVPGINRGEAFMTCKNGTTIKAEFVTGSGTASGNGRAEDSLGNVYKLIF